MLRTLAKRLLKSQGYAVTNLKQVPKQLRSDDCQLTVNFDLVISDHLLKKQGLNEREVFFIQVGAFDGLQGDPIRKYVTKHRWRGVLLEPQKAAFEKLKENYADQPQLILRNAAIARERGTRVLFTVVGDGLPEWCQQLASFDYNVIARHKYLVPDIEEFIVPEEIECVTFEDTLGEIECETIDLLQVDAEGYDSEIVQMFPYDRLPPAIIHLERKHLSRLQMEQCLAKLMRYGYRFANDGAEDFIAYRRCDS
jgi:FkbM family methyltransferase